MEKINWKQKLTSRKFWAAIIGVITTVCVIFGVEQIKTEQVVALVSAISLLIAYIVGEGLVDSARIKAPSLTTFDTISDTEFPELSDLDEK